jgi:hypothetical protein
MQSKTKEGVDSSNFTECQNKPVIPESIFQEYFFMSSGLSFLEEHPYFLNSTPKEQFNEYSFNQISRKETSSIHSKSDFILSAENLNPSLQTINKKMTNSSQTNIKMILESFLLETSNNQENNISISSKITDPSLQIKFQKLFSRYKTFKMINDAFNEALCSWRPFAIKGQPLPGYSHFSRLNKIKIQASEIKYIFSVTINKLMDSSFLSCGVLPEREEVVQQRFNPEVLDLSSRKILEVLFSNMNSDPFMNHLNSSEILSKLREEKLIRFLNWDIYETDDKWLFYDYEVLETQMNIQDLVFDYLLTDILKDFLVSK